MKGWDDIYSEYCRKCLNADGDFDMTLIDWLKANYPPPVQTMPYLMSKALGKLSHEDRVKYGAAD